MPEDKRIIGAESPASGRAGHGCNALKPHDDPIPARPQPGERPVDWFAH